MIRWGLSYGHHDAAAVIMEGDTIIASKRYGTKDIYVQDIDDLISIAGVPDEIYTHENKLRDALRKVISRDWYRLFPRTLSLPIKPIRGNHHLSHAAAGFYTSKFRDALVVVADAVGEMESLAVYRAHTGRLDTSPVFTLKYPDSVGLFYSYHTAMIGLQPNKDENKLMELSLQSSYKNYPLVANTVDSFYRLGFKCIQNFHSYPEHIVTDPIEQKWIAATTQHIAESYIINLVKRFTDNMMSNVVFTGGVAYNSLIKEALIHQHHTVYVPSHPGDAGSALGAILQHTHQHVELKDGKIFNV
jgi:carbamoyltransferase